MMDATMMRFVEPLGPGQIVDRQSLAALPNGCVRVIISNNEKEMRIHAIEIKETYDSNTNLELNVSIKAFLSINNIILEGQVLSNKSRISSKSLLIFDKTEAYQTNGVVEDRRQILQICVFAIRKSHKSKIFLGIVHIAIDELWLDLTSSPYLAAWYKVFPQSSFIAGCPTPYGMPYCVYRQTVFSRPNEAYFKKILSLPDLSTMSSSPITSSSSEQNFNGENMNRKETLQRISRLILKIIPSKPREDITCQNMETENVEESAHALPDAASDRISSCSSFKPVTVTDSAVLNLNLLKTSNGHAQVIIDSETPGSTGSSRIFNSSELFQPLPSQSRLTKKTNHKRKKLKHWRSFSIPAITSNSSTDDDKTFKRSEEVVCTPSSSCNTPTSDALSEFICSNDKSVQSLNSSSTSGRTSEGASNLSHSLTNHSLSKSGNLQANDEIISMTAETCSQIISKSQENLSVHSAKKHKRRDLKLFKNITLPSWIRHHKSSGQSASNRLKENNLLHKKKKHKPYHSAPTNLAPTDFPDDNAYEVLLSLKQITKETSRRNSSTFVKSNSAPYASTSRLENCRRNSLELFFSKGREMSKSPSESALPAAVGERECHSSNKNSICEMPHCCIVTSPGSEDIIDFENFNACEAKQSLTLPNTLKRGLPKSPCSANQFDDVFIMERTVKKQSPGTCFAKRNIFAFHPSTAIELCCDNDINYLKFDSEDDDYSSCCERLSSTNLSITSSLYATASES